VTIEHKPPEHPHPALSEPAEQLASAAGSVAVRRPASAEVPQHFSSVDAAYGTPFSPMDQVQQERFDEMVPLANRSVAVERSPDGGERIIGGQVRIDSALSLPGGASVPVAALSGVGVEPGAHGRGAFRALIREHLREARARGDAGSVLMASLTPLYGRFGYGPATETANWEIDAPAAALQVGAPTQGPVFVEHARGARLHEVLDAVWRAVGTARAGTLERAEAWWRVVLAPEETWLGGGKLMVARHGTAPGYVLYTVDGEHGRQGLAEADIRIRELVAADPAVELDLWRFIAGLPWGRTIRWHYAPVDPAALFWLRDPRQLRRMSHFDFLWLRPLDMPRLTAQRRFAADGRVTLEVTDPVFGDLAGRFALQVRNGSGTWAVADGPADLALSIADLGAMWLGGGSSRQLRAVGRIGGDAAAAHRLDAMLACDGPPRAVARF